MKVSWALTQRRLDVQHEALMGQTIDRLSPVLVFNLMRFDFNYTTLTRVKLTSKYEIPLVLDMRPFVAGGKYASVAVNTSESEKEKKARMVRD